MDSYFYIGSLTIFVLLRQGKAKDTTPRGALDSYIHLSTKIVREGLLLDRMRKYALKVQQIHILCLIPYDMKFTSAL